MTEGRQPFTAEIKTLAKGPSTYDPLENDIALPCHSRSKPEGPQRLGLFRRRSIRPGQVKLYRLSALHDDD